MSTIEATQRGNPQRPPLVKSWPIIGPARQFLGDVLPFLYDCRQTYGDAYRIRMAHLEMTCLLGDEAIDLLRPDSGLRTSHSMHVLDSQMQSRLPSTFDGPHHIMFRKAHLQFMNRNLETKCRDDIQHCLTQHTERWQPGVELDMLHEAQTQTVDVLSNILNGEPFPFTKKELALVVHTMIWATFGHAPKLVLMNPKYRSALSKMRQHLVKVIDEIKANPELADTTLVGHYLKMEPLEELGGWHTQDLVAVPLGAYLAGFDTLAAASSFLIYQLLTHPECLAKARAEYAQLGQESPDGRVDPVSQKYLRAAFLETTRINPPGPAVLRYADRDIDFGNYRIRKGDEILIVIAGEHRNEQYFPQPDRFDPERFFGDNASDLKKKVLPFSTGNHRCTGSMLGELMAVEMVSYWINHFDLQLVPGSTVKPEARPYTQPKGLRVEVVGRR